LDGVTATRPTTFKGIRMSELSYIEISLFDIRPNPDNTRSAREVDRDHPKMQELTQSVKATGVLQPIVVREHPGPTKYEIVFGERRFRASGYAGLEKVPAIIRCYSDAEVLDLILVENFQRENPDPMAEARALAKYKERGYDLEQAARKIGRSYAWAAKRAGLVNLSPAWMKAYDERSLENWGLDHLMLIARYDGEIQERLWARFQHSLDYMTLKDLTEKLAQEMRDVSKAPWDLDDTEIVPEAGACNTCQKRTSCQRLIFDDLPTPKGKEPDFCTDSDCWGKKSATTYQRRLAEAREKNPDIRQVSTMRYHTAEGVIGQADYETCKKSDKGAIQAIAADGNNPGKVLYIRAAETVTATGKKVAKLPGDPAPTLSLSDKRSQLDRRRTLWAINALIEVITAIPIALPKLKLSKQERELIDESDDMVVVPDADEEGEEEGAEEGENASETKITHDETGTRPDLDQLVLWTFAQGVRSESHRYGGIVQEAAAKLAKGIIGTKPEELADSLWCVVKPSMLEHLKMTVACKRVDDEWIPIVCTATDVNFKKIKSAAEKAIPEPKSWRTQYPEEYAQKGKAS
jgi:ParB/RepB/Spo0J family partition protein